MPLQDMDKKKLELQIRKLSVQKCHFVMITVGLRSYAYVLGGKFH